MNDVNVKRSTYPRVSDIIGKQNESEMRCIPLDHLAEAAIRGSRIHGYCTAYVKGLALPDIEPDYNPYVETFMKWCDENVQRALLCTTRLYDDVKRFSGEPDMIVMLKNGERALIDLKTTAASSKTWPVQLAAYDHLCKLNKLEYEQIFILHLKKKPKKKEENLLDSPREVKAIELSVIGDISDSWEIFSSALRCYDYFSRKEPKEAKNESTK